MKRIDVTFAEAFLPRVAQAVLTAARPNTGKALECTGVLVVLPGRRAARRLVELLAEHAQQQRRLLIPPRVCTPQHLCEVVCQSCGYGAIATEHEQHAAWLCALDEHRELVAALMGRDDAQACAARPALLFSLARTLDGVYTALAGERVTCDDVAAAFDAGSTGRARWQALGALVEAMRAELAARQLCTLHDATEAALAALQKDASRAVADTQEIIIAGIVDPFAQFTACVHALAERVTVMTYGPDGCGWFDECGALRRDVELDFGVLDEHVERIVCADSAAAQAHAVLAWLREAAHGHAMTDIVIGAPDAEVNRPLRAALALEGVAAHDAIGTPFAESSLGVLLSTLVELIEERTWSAALQLMRHPVVERYMCRTLMGGPRTPKEYARLVWRVEEYLADHVVQHVTQERPRAHDDDVEAEVGLLTQALLNLLERFAGERALFEWIVPLNECLEKLYAGSDSGAAQDEEALRAWSEFSAGLDEARVQPRAPLKAAVALRQLMALAGAMVLAPPRSAPAVDIVGWLELALDDAPVVAVTGMNEGVLSESVTSDAFLPDGLRQRLGLPCNERRLQRDRYIMRTITGTGKTFLLTAGRASNKGDPLRISRVLCDMSAANQARLMLKFYGKSGREDLESVAWHFGASAQPPLVIAPPSDKNLTLEITSLSATDFARYVACGYAFYLHKTVGEPPTPPGAELSPSQFGQVLHKVLEVFGRSGPKDSTNTHEITAWLCEELARSAARRYGRAPGLAIELQLDSCRRRLAAFAEVQAARVREGWQIVAAEQTERDTFTVAGIPIVTRMDRIDQRGNEVVILDYKTGSADSHDPAKTYSEGVWKDLQLPLYWLSAQASGAYAGCEIKTGYFKLPSKLEACEVVTTPWGEADYASALAVAEEIIARMRANEPGTFMRTDNTAQCAACPYRYLCQRV